MKGVKEVAVFWLEDKGWIPSLSQALFSMYQSKSLCDTMLISSDGETIPCHSSVLAAASPYLCNLLKAATQNFLKVNIQVSIPSAVLKQVVDFIYLGRSAAFQAQLDELTAAAEQLDIGGLKSACSKWENAVGAAAVVQESHSYAQVHEPADQEVVDTGEDDAAEDSHELTAPPGEGDINQPPFQNSNAELPAAEEASQPTIASTQPKSTFQCLVCGRKFGQMSHLQQHSRLHTGERPYSCKYCQKRFTISSNLNRHLKIHTGERPYVCGTCYRSFNQSSHLKQHERSHTGTKPYECKLCKRLFSKTSHLKRHMMLHTGEKPFKCTQCPRAFTDSSHLREHAMIHTGERPYVCKYCQRAFTFKSSMVQHLRLHTGEKPYHCDVCNKDFARFQQLKEHKIIHTGKRSFECLECGAAFFLKEQFKTHMESHQGARFKFKHECSVCHRIYSKKKALEKHEIKMHSNVPALVENQAAVDQSSNQELNNAAEQNNTNQDDQSGGDRSAIKIKQEPVDSVADEEVEDANLDGNETQINGDELTSDIKFQYLCAVPSEDQQGEQKLEASIDGQQVMLQPSLQQQIEQTLLQVGYAETSEGDGDEQVQGQEIQVLIVEEGFEFSDATHVPIVLQDDEAAAQ